MGVENNPCIEAYIGASGSGKSTAIKRRLMKAKPNRLIIVDPMGEYGKYAPPVSTIKELLAKANQKTFAVSFKTSKLNPKDQFETICDIAYSIGNLWLVVEELSLYTSAQSAPPSWSDCTMRGRHMGMTVIGASQRPSRIDKDFFGNCSMIHTGRLNFANDAKTMADALNVPKIQITELLPFHYIEKDMGSGRVTTGIVQKLK